MKHKPNRGFDYQGLKNKNWFNSDPNYDYPNNRKIWSNPLDTKQILKLDFAYVEKLVTNYYGANLLMNEAIVVEKAGFYIKPQFSCDIVVGCEAGSLKRKYRPACFYPTSGGYIYRCSACGACLTLFQYLLKRNPDIARKYAIERWIKGYTGSSYNCPEPPKNWKAEYYKLKERELKEKNKKAYEERMKNEN